MKRGDLVTIAMQGDFGKPRPAMVLQSDRFMDTATVTIVPVTSSLIDAPLFRINLKPNEHNGLKKVSQVMVDKTMTVKRERVGQQIGEVSTEDLLQIERCLAVFLGIAR